jgi:homospermidine synthase
MKNYDGKILFTGYGAVAHALLPMLFKHVRVPYGNVTIIDFAKREAQLAPWLKKGVVFVRERVTPANMSRLLSSHVSAGGLIIDLSWSIDCFEILDWARSHDVLYVNASLESWDPTANMQSQSTLDKALYTRYARMVGLVPRWRGASTAVIDHGLNPGLISHFVKRGLLDIAERAISEDDTPSTRRRNLEKLRAEERFAELSCALGVKVIHCSESDTQRARTAKSPDEFVNTWSVEGMWEEALMPSELGWGTHEKWLPPFAIRPKTGPRNQIVLPQMGLNTWVRSCVPGREIVGMAVTHGESFSLSYALTLRRDGKVAYRPTVNYAYLPANDALVSLHELRCRLYEPHPRTRILSTEIVEGEDVVGALIMGHRYRSWWVGSMLSIQSARKKVPQSNATAVQVASGMLAAILWTLSNPRKGLCFPEDLPHDVMLRHARPYLGRIVSKAMNWSPLDRFRLHFYDRPDVQPDWSDPWQFRNFIFRP